MQRRASKNTRLANSQEKAFMVWTKEQPCCICGAPGPSIVDHMYGSTFKHNKVLIGMWALLPYCFECDKVKTNGSHFAHLKEFACTQADLWESSHLDYSIDTGQKAPTEACQAIMDWGR